MQPQQLRQVTSDRHLPALSALALVDGDHALDEADILDTKLHKLRSPGAGLQQRLQHQAGAAVLGVGLVEEAKLFLNCQPIDAAAMFRGRPQPGALPRGFEDGLALRVVDPLAHEDGGDSGGGALDRGHEPVCCDGIRSASLWPRALRMGQSRRGSACRTGLQLSTPVIVESSLAGDPRRRGAMRVEGPASNHRR